jgi:AbrB family looped-hinge helix DNA binding protein
MIQEISRMGKRGAVVIPSALRKRFGLADGSVLAAEEREDGILLRPATVVPLEIYSNRRKAEFLLNNAVDAADYEAARRDVRALGLDPDDVPHQRPGRRA